VEVLNREDQRTLLTVVQYEVSQECKGPDLAFLRAGVRQPRVVYGDIEELEQQGLSVF